ncbi:MAG: hypothetical protein ACOC2U_04655 [bacterium]
MELDKRKIQKESKEVVVDKTKYHSVQEKEWVENIKKIDLKEADKELDKRVVVQYRDQNTNRDYFNAFYKNVLIHDENGNRIMINNHDEIKKQKLKNAGKLIKQQDVGENDNNASGYDPDIIDDVEFE